MRKPIIAGNWKMHKTLAEARALAAEVVAAVGQLESVEVILAPPNTALAAVAEVVRGSRVAVAAQNMHWADKGAYTGAVSPIMVKELATHVILGHSERRQHFAETDEGVNRKVHAAFAHGLVPIICVGETTSERDAGATDVVVRYQLAAAVEGLGESEVSTAVVAYEPVWAIGTGRACDPAEAARVTALIRQVLAEAYGAGTAELTRVLYGGSVNPANVEAYLQCAGVDGGLVGGASLEAESFIAMVRSAERH